MSEIFRKHYSYGETIPILDTNVGMMLDLYEVPGRPSPAGGPYLKAVFVASAGPMKSAPIVAEPVQEHESRVVHLANIPVPIPGVRTVDISLIFDLVNYRWIPSQEPRGDSGLIAFDLRLRAAFSVLGKSYTLQLDQRPCTLTVSGETPQRQVPLFASGGMDGMQRGQPIGEHEGAPTYGSPERFVQPGRTITGETATNQLDVEEHLRQISTRLVRQ
jgi:hypothetical protein